MKMGKHGDIPAETTVSNKIKCRSRRRFWRDLLEEIVVIGEEMQGIGHQSLREIGNLPDSVLAEMVPVWRQGVLLEIRETGIYRVNPDDGASCKYRFKANEKMMVDQYACGRNLQTIANHVARVCNLEEEQAFETTKNLFVQLCQYGWCHPAAPYVPEKGEKQ